MKAAEAVSLMHHMAWADALVWRAVFAHPPAGDDARLRERLYHIHAVQRAFLQVWQGTPLKLPEPSSFDDLRDLERWARPCYSEAAAYLSGLSGADFERPVSVPWSRHLERRYGTIHDATLAETVLHVSAHSTYHRGQVNAQLRQLGAEPPLVDLIVWTWLGKPGAGWDAPPRPDPSAT